MGIGVNSIIKRNSIQIIFDESSLFFIFFYFGTLKFTKKKIFDEGKSKTNNHIREKGSRK